MEFQARYLALFFFFSKRRLWVILDGKSSQEYPVNAAVPQGSILGPILFLLHIKNLPDDVICNTAIYIDVYIYLYLYLYWSILICSLYSKCDQAFNLLHHLDLASEFESDIRDTANWGMKWLVVFNAGKTQPDLFDQSKTLVLLV